MLKRRATSTPLVDTPATGTESVAIETSNEKNFCLATPLATQTALVMHLR